MTPKRKAVDAWLAGKPPEVRFIVAELSASGEVCLRASSDENDDEGPVSVGSTYDEALVELEKLLGKALFS